MMTRALVLFFIASLPIPLYEYIFHKYYKARQVPVALGVFLLLCVLAVRISSAWIGALTALDLFPPATRASGSLTALIGLLLGLWLAALLIQLAQNAVRWAIGEPPRPISLIRLYRHYVKR
jgi:hypothetical protein